MKEVFQIVDNLSLDTSYTALSKLSILKVQVTRKIKFVLKIDLGNLNTFVKFLRFTPSGFFSCGD